MCKIGVSPGVQLRLTREDEGPLQSDLLVPPLPCQHGERTDRPVACKLERDVTDAAAHAGG